MPTPLEPKDWQRILQALFVASGLALLALLATRGIHGQGASILSQPAPAPIDFSAPSP